MWQFSLRRIHGLIDAALKRMPLKRRTPTPAEQARVYRDAGLRVMPIAMPAKAPAVPKGFYGKAQPDATAEPEDFERRHQVGILCGRVEHRDDVELFGLDRDGAAEWSDLEEALGIELPPTLSSKGDRHRYYWLPAGHGLKQRNGIVPKIDARTHAGGYFREPWEWDAPFGIDAIEALDADTVEALRALIGTAKDDCAEADDGRIRAFGGWGLPLDISAVAELVDDERHEAVRMIAGYVAHRGHTPERIAEAVREQIGGERPHARGRQAWQAARRAWLGLPVPGWQALVGRFGEAPVRALEESVRDPAEPEGFAGVWTPWWAAYWPKLVSNWHTPKCAHEALAAVPEWCRAHVEACRNAIRTPVDMNLLIAIGVMSAAVQGRVVVRVNRTWSEHTALYVCAVADPSEAKSPALELAARPIREWEQAERERTRPAYVAAKQERKDLHKLAEKIEKERWAHYGEFTDGVPVPGELLAIQTKLEKPEPVEFRYTVEDVTPEKLVMLLGDQGRLLVMTDEGASVFGMLAGKYNEQADVTAWCKAYNGQSVIVDRVGEKTKTPWRPWHTDVTMSAIVMTQPAPFSEAVRNRAFVGQGLTQRFCWYVAPVTGARWKDGEGDNPVPQAVDDRYAEGVRTMLEIGKRDVGLAPGVEADVWAWRLELDRRAREDGGDLQDQRGWAGKHVGRTLRVAGILWAADGGKEPAITADQFARAVTIARWLLFCSVGAFRSRRVEIGDSLADRIVEIVKAGGVRSGSDIQRKLARGQREAYKPVLAQLINDGVLAETADGIEVVP